MPPRLARSQSAERTFVAPAINKVRTLLPDGLVWLRREQRLMLGEEKLHVHGMHPDRYPWNCTQSQLNDLAGNSFNGYQFAIIFTASLLHLPMIFTGAV